MPSYAEVWQFTAQTTLGNQDFVIPHRNTELCRGALLIASFGSTNESALDEAIFSTGFIATDTGSFCGGFFDQHNQATANSGTIGYDTEVIALHGPSGAVWLATFVAFLNGGIRVNWSKVSFLLPPSIKVVFFFGSDTTVDVTRAFQAPGTDNDTEVVNDLSILSDAVIGFQIGDADFDDAVNADADFGIGVWSREQAEGRFSGIFSDDGDSTTDNAQLATTNFLAQILFNVERGRITLESFTSSGFTMRCESGGFNIADYSVGLMGIKLPDGVKVRVAEVEVDGVGRVKFGDLPFVPGLAILLPSLDINSTPGVADASDVWSFGVGLWSPRSQNCASCQSEDFQATSDTQSVHSTDRAIYMPDDDGSPTWRAYVTEARNGELHVYNETTLGTDKQILMAIIFEEDELPGCHSAGSDRLVSVLAAADTGLTIDADFRNDRGFTVDKLEMTESTFREGTYYLDIPSDFPRGHYWVDILDGATLKETIEVDWGGSEHGGVIRPVDEMFAMLDGKFLACGEITTATSDTQFTISTLGAEYVNASLDDALVMLIRGDHVDTPDLVERSIVTAYNSTTDQVTVSPAFSATPEVGDRVFFILSGAGSSVMASAVWAELLANNQVAGSFGEAFQFLLDSVRIVNTTVATVTSQTEFDLVETDVADIDDMYLDRFVLIEDVSAGESTISQRRITDYQQLNSRITIDSAPEFTVVVGDKVTILTITATPSNFSDLSVNAQGRIDHP